MNHTNHIKGGNMLDNVDKKLLKVLQENAKISIKELSSLINMSQPATSERVRKLERNGYIESYTIKLNPKKFNKNFICFCFIILKSSDGACDEKFRDYTCNCPDILECYCITGPYEYIIKVATESPLMLEDVLVRIRSEFPIKSYTYSVLCTVKGETQFPV